MNDKPAAPDFDSAFRANLLDLFAWRRDVRRFRTEPLPQGMLERFIDIACLAPSVGLSQPWRFVILWTAVCAVLVYIILSWAFGDGGIGPCPGMVCGMTIWGLIIVGVIWLSVVGLVLYFWHR